MLEINNKLVLLSLSFFSLILLNSCNYENTTINLGSGFDSTWTFSNSSDYEFDENFIEVVSGKAQLKVLDLEHSGDDFNSGNHVGSYLEGSNNFTVLDKPTANTTHVNTILPEKLSNLVGYWRMDGDFIDSSINGNNGTTYGDVSASGNEKIGSASAIFDGAGDFVDVGTGNSLDIASMTISSWVHMNVDNYGRIASRHSGIIGNYGWVLARNNVLDTVEFRISTNGSNWIGGNTSANSFPTNTWTHIAATYDGSFLRVYINGVEDTTGDFPFAISGNIFVSTHSVRIGADHVSPHFMNGLIDDVALWNDALSKTQILKLYQAQSLNFTELSPDWTPKYENMVGYWKMDGNWQDSSGNGNHGITTGAPTFATESQVGSQSGSFNGTTDYLSTPRVIDSKNFTVAGWVKLDVIAGYSYPFWQGETQLRIDGAGVITGRYFDNSSFFTVTANTRAMSGQWYHLAMSTNGNNLSLYVNGIEEGTAVDISSAATPPLVANSILAKDEQPSFLPGQLDDLAVWGVGLTNHEINVIFNRQKQKYASQYDSEVLDLGSSSAAWPDLSWSTRLPFGKELVGDFDNDGNPDSESSSDYSYQSGDLSDGLIGYWRFENNTTESSQNLSDISVNAPTYVPGQLGMAAQFNGVNTGVIVSEDLGDQSELTIALWYKDDGTDSGWRFVADARASETWWLGFPVSSDQLEFAGVRLGANLPAIGVWQHFLIRATSSSVELYIDGAFVESGSPVNLDIGASLRLGNRYTDNEALSGGIDEFGLWSRALSSSEIQQLYRRGANRIKLQVKSCVDSSCNCKSYGAGGSETDCDGDTILNTADTDDIHKSEFIGPGGDGTTYYSELFNRTDTEVTFNCALNITDGDAGVCAPDEITLTAGPKPTGPEFLNIDYTQFVTPPANRYAQYRVYMEADENTACGGEPCLPELTSVSLNPTGVTRYSSEYIKVKPKSPITFTKLLSAQIDADTCATFRLSRSNTEYYYDGASWVPATADAHRNPASVVESNITKFARDHGAGQLEVNAYLASDASQATQCSVNFIDVKYE